MSYSLLLIQPEKTAPPGETKQKMIPGLLDALEPIAITWQIEF